VFMTHIRICSHCNVYLRKTSGNSTVWRCDGQFPSMYRKTFIWTIAHPHYGIYTVGWALRGEFGFFPITAINWTTLDLPVFWVSACLIHNGVYYCQGRHSNVTSSTPESRRHDVLLTTTDSLLGRLAESGERRAESGADDVKNTRISSTINYILVRMTRPGFVLHEERSHE